MTNTEKQLHRSIVGTIEQNEKYRTEPNLLDELQVPADAYYDVRTQRAINNYRISGTKMCNYPQFIMVIAYVKKAAAAVNTRLGAFDKNTADHICQATDDIIGGKSWGNSCIDMIQGGAGTPANMNVNEVIANRALKLMGYKRGDYVYCYPNDHVNCGQSTSDAYPTSLHYAAYRISRDLLRGLEALVDCLRAKVNEPRDTVKMGRTRSQDTIPMTLGQEFTAFASTLEDELEYIEYSARKLLVINMGATVIGTGFDAVPGYADLITEYLTKFTDNKSVKAKDMIAATPDTGGYVSYLGVSKRLAVELSRACNDLHLMASGPRCGLYEINSPPTVPGSSITPGRIGPVIPEVTNQMCFEVIGNDMAITMVVEAEQLQLNIVESVIIECVFGSITWMINVINIFREKYVSGITLNEKHNLDMVKHPTGIVTAPNPYARCKSSTKVAKEALEIGKSLHEIVMERNLMSAEEVGKILDLKAML